MCWAVFGGARTSHGLESFRVATKYQDEKIIQYRDMSWAVIGGIGDHGPTIDLRVFQNLYNIKTKKIFNTVR